MRRSASRHHHHCYHYHRVRAYPPRWSRFSVIAVLCLVVLGACGLHNGSEEIAFVQHGKLWTIQSDGTSAHTDSQNTVLEFAWSPDHHQLVFRYLTDHLPHASAPGPLSLTGVADAPANLAIQSVNGGYALQITPTQPGELRSAAWWNADGNRLVYREATTPGGPALYIVSQADQPVGIGRKILLDDASLPALAPDGKQVAVIDPSGAVRVGAPGTLGHVVATGAMRAFPGAGSGRPARALWQPHHNALLYATASASGVAFVLCELTNGVTRTLATTASVLDAAFSPDGTLLLVRTPSSFELWNASGAGAATPVYSWLEMDALALPWWSPDSHAILVQDATGWTVVDVSAQSVRRVVTFPSASSPSPVTVPDAATWTVATGDPWNPDGSQVVFAAVGGSLLNGTPLTQPKQGGAGLYVANVQAGRMVDASLIYSGEPQAPAWGYASADTVFLVPGENE